MLSWEQHSRNFIDFSSPSNSISIFFRLKRHRQQQQHHFESIVDVVERKLYEKINSKPAFSKIVLKLRKFHEFHQISLQNFHFLNKFPNFRLSHSKFFHQHMQTLWKISCLSLPLAIFSYPFCEHKKKLLNAQPTQTEFFHLFSWGFHYFKKKIRL